MPTASGLAFFYHLGAELERREVHARCSLPNQLPLFEF
jgi:hypothetical protein